MPNEVMMSVVECRKADCRYAECHQGECRYAACRGAATLTSFSSLNKKYNLLENTSNN